MGSTRERVRPAIDKKIRFQPELIEAIEEVRAEGPPGKTWSGALRELVWRGLRARECEAR